MPELETIGPEVARQVEQLTPPSFCVACDAAEGECDHRGARYHESWFEYQTAPGSGKIRPEYEVWFHRNDHGFENLEERSAPKPRSLATVRAELSPWVYFDDSLESRLEAAYELNPHQVSLLSADLRGGFEAGRIEKPGGTLVSALKKIKPATAT